MSDAVSYKEFYEAVIASGSILAGFSGTFLQFRLQREASYYRQAAVSLERIGDNGDEGGIAEPGVTYSLIGGHLYRKLGQDVSIRLSHFSVSFLMLVISVMLSFVFGFLLPLFALSGVWPYVDPGPVVAGLTSATLFLMGYFLTELYHYNIVPLNLPVDKREWWKELCIFFFTSLVIAGLASWFVASRVHGIVAPTATVTIEKLHLRP